MPRQEGSSTRQSLWEGFRVLAGLVFFVGLAFSLLGLLAVVVG
jgi:hypothetical protein